MSAFNGARNVELTFQGAFASAGFSSGLTQVQNNSVLSINFKCTVDTVLKIFSCPTQDDTEKQLFFEKTISANTVFHRRFAAPHQYVSIDVENTGAVADGSLLLDVCDYIDIHFDASTFLNSNIDIDTQTNLVRVANDYNTDMVREIHPDFKKINIQAFTQTQDTAEATIGNNGGDITSYTSGVGVTHALFANFAGTQDTSVGTGAREITIEYVDANFDEQTAVVSSSTGGLISLGITGRLVQRVFVSGVGSGKANSGSITITESTNTEKFAFIPTGDNVSHTGIFLIPRNKHLIVTDAQLSLVGYNGLIRIFEWDYGGIQTKASIGDFRISSQNLTQTFRLNGKITEKKAVVINVIPDVGTPTNTTNICININGVLCPAINNF